MTTSPSPASPSAAPTGSPGDVRADYLAADRRLTALLDGVDDAGWASPSPCEGWAARDVVAHLVETQRSFLAERGVELGDAADVRADPAGAWRAHADAVATALADPAVPATPFDGFFGPTTLGEALGRFYVWDMVVHRWDVARAVGDPAAATFTPDELPALEAGADSFGPALHMDGICRAGVEAPEGASREVRLLARLGRTA